MRRIKRLLCGMRYGQAVEPKIGEMPLDERSHVEAIRAECTAALGAAKTTRAKQDAYLQGLLALETVPAVIRVAWRILLASKHVGKVETYLHAPTDAFGMAYEAMVMPEAPVAMAAAPAPLEPPEVSFFTDVRFPERVKRSEVQWLTVQLTLEAVEESAVAATVPVRFESAKPNELPPPEFVEVRLVAPGFNEVTGVWERTMTVYPAARLAPRGLSAVVRQNPVPSACPSTLCTRDA